MRGMRETSSDGAAKIMAVKMLFLLLNDYWRRLCLVPGL